MAKEGSLTFAKVIEEHLELKRRNARIEDEMPIDRYRSTDRIENHPLFKTEEQARFEETMTGSDTSLDRELALVHSSAARDVENDDDESFWRRSRDFDWGD